MYIICLICYISLNEHVMKPLVWLQDMTLFTPLQICVSFHWHGKVVVFITY